MFSIVWAKHEVTGSLETHPLLRAQNQNLALRKGWATPCDVRTEEDRRKDRERSGRPPPTIVTTLSKTFTVTLSLLLLQTILKPIRNLAENFRVCGAILYAVRQC